MRFNSVESIRAAGFAGFESASDLRASNLSRVPTTPGIYMVVREPAVPPVFAIGSCGGRFKGKDPTVAIETLVSNWIPGTAVIYIGKAGGGSSAATLRKRLTSYVRFGDGEPVGHWGGRFIWQIEDANNSLRFCWRSADGSDAAVVERELIKEFVRQLGGRPFANLRD